MKEPPKISQADLGAALGVKPRRVRDLLNSGALPPADGWPAQWDFHDLLCTLRFDQLVFLVRNHKIDEATVDVIGEQVARKCSALVDSYRELKRFGHTRDFYKSGCVLSEIAWNFASSSYPSSVFGSQTAKLCTSRLQSALFVVRKEQEKIRGKSAEEK